MTKSIGFASTAHIHFKGFAEEIAASEGAARIGAIWDDDEERGRRRAAQCGAEFVPRLDDLAARDDLDGFVICATNRQRLDLFRTLAPAGKPIMCEKPLALMQAEAREIRALVAESKLIVTTGFFRHAYGVYHAASHLLRQGALGNITHARFRNAHDGAYRRIFDDPHVAWMADPAAAGGGGALDMGAHALDLLAWLFGPAEEVWATISNRSGIYPKVDDSGIFHIRFRSGVLATAEAGWIDIDGPGGLEIFGDAGSLHAGDLYTAADAYIVGSKKERQPVTVGPSGPKGVSRLLAAMDGKIAGDELADELDAAAQAVAMMEAAYRSNATGIWEKIDPL